VPSKKPKDLTIEILKGIRAELAGLRADTNARFDEHGEALEKLAEIAATSNERLGLLERHAVATNELLGLMNSRLSFFERASTAAAEGRQRLEADVDDLKHRVEALEEQRPSQ